MKNSQNSEEIFEKIVKKMSKIEEKCVQKFKDIPRKFNKYCEKFLKIVRKF